jgi:hypothetical protein
MNILYKIVYSRNICLQYAYQYLNILALNCSDLRRGPITYANSPNCLNRSQFMSLEILAQNNSNGSVNKLIQQFCPIDCNFNVYDPILSVNKFPTQNYYTEILFYHLNYFTSIFGDVPVTYEMIQSSLTSGFIYLDKVEVTQMTESEAINMLTLLTNLMNTIGCFVGISVLSCIEILEVIGILVWVLIKHAFNKKIEKVCAKSEQCSPDVNQKRTWSTNL